MKIRQGFVSNSSSASYIVTLNKPFSHINALFIDIYETCWLAMIENEFAYFDRNELINRREDEENKTTIVVSVFNGLVEERPERERVLTGDEDHYVDSDVDRIEIVSRTLDYEDIEVTQVDSKWTLTYFTSMHNSFYDMNRLLTCIYLEYLMENGGADLKFQSDN